MTDILTLMASVTMVFVVVIIVVGLAIPALGRLLKRWERGR